MKLVCPKDSNHKEFIAAATVREDWVVDVQGNFLALLGEDHEPLEAPGPSSHFACRECGATAEKWEDCRTVWERKLSTEDLLSIAEGLLDGGAQGEYRRALEEFLHRAALCVEGGSPDAITVHLSSTPGESYFTCARRR